MIIKDLQITQNLIIGASGSGVQFPTTDGLPGYLLTTDGAGVVAWGPGTPGPTGPTGPFGGPQGPTGFQGPSGPAGGPQGVTGDQGRTGSQGFQGSQGRTGPQGFQGSQGRTGPQGNTGPQGLAGTPGGPQGPIGDQGPFGPQGDMGPIGPQGNQGPQGPGVTTILNDTFISLDTITITHSLGYYPVVQVLNDIYEEIIPVSVTHNSVNDYTIILATSTSGVVITGAGGEGPQGDQGPIGDQGHQGPTGDVIYVGQQGSTGPQGFQGDMGPQGNTGPQGYTGPQGSGSQGSTGPQGPTGTQGYTGPIGDPGPSYVSTNFSGPWQGLPLAYGIEETWVTYGGSTWFTVNVGAGDGIPPSPTNSNWTLFAGAALIIGTAIPISSSSDGSKGEIRVDNGEYLYIHTGDQWLKSSMTFSTF